MDGDTNLLLELVLEVLEVSIVQILFYRGIYKKDFFRNAQRYGVTVKEVLILKPIAYGLENKLILSNRILFESQKYNHIWISFQWTIFSVYLAPSCEICEKNFETGCSANSGNGSETLKIYQYKLYYITVISKQEFCTIEWFLYQYVRQHLLTECF